MFYSVLQEYAGDSSDFWCNHPIWALIGISPQTRDAITGQLYCRKRNIDRSRSRGGLDGPLLLLSKTDIRKVAIWGYEATPPIFSYRACIPKSRYIEASKLISFFLN